MVCGIPVTSLNGLVSIQCAQVTDFTEVEPNLLQKRGWRVVISQKWKFGDGILLRKARELFRSLQVMLCGTHL